MPHLRGGARPSPAPGPAPPPRSQRSGLHLPRRERATAPAPRTALGSGVRSGGSLGFARAPPLPLFSSDAAVEAVAAAAAAAAVPRPEAHPPACGSRLPLPLPRHQRAPPPRRAGCLERGEKRPAEEREGRGRRAVARRLASSPGAALLPPLSGVRREPRTERGRQRAELRALLPPPPVRESVRSE